MVLAAGLALLFLVWDAVIMRPSTARDTEMDTTLKGLQTQIATLQESAALLEARLETDPRAETLHEVSELHTRVERLDELIHSRTTKLISPLEMARLLEKLLERVPDVHLVSLEALPTEPLFESVTEPLAGVLPETAFYKHGMRIELEAGFAETLAFIQEMERLPWSIFWDSLQYDVPEYPRARVTLVVHTLSTREGWIGV
jgi:MSHA biogenesis protein MshJ